ncbi:alpha/beta hydrolase [Flavobacterium sp. JLP]|uniref:alpha/beta fold hydrolase n=1 Tax=Flavobacterium sp. JLP TaxID=2783793 RepID=UPI00188A100C|nr:alpha/beta hydrolase [Flavobacterium sp. JLP]MBF4505279.1 alpha/beta hydrolase [Flavobacterium sp. JLP]
MKKLYHTHSKPLLSIFILLTITFGYSQKNESNGTRKLIHANGIQIETFVYGNGPVALIMAAGNGRPAIQLDELAQAIASKGIKVITYNYRTLGASTGKIEGLTLHDYADDLWKVADELGLKEVYLAGKTYGNRVVRTASQDHPERVLGIVLIGAGGEVQPSVETMALYQRYMDPSISKEEWLKLQGQLMYAPGNEHLALLDQAQGEFPTLAGQQAKSSDATPKEQWSTGGTAPMLVITCLLDRVAVPESALNIAKERPKTWLVGLPLCGHNMLNEKGNDIKRLMVEFILNTPSDEVKSAKQD